MRGLPVFAAAALCGALLSACGGQPGPHQQAHPDGWKQQGQGADAVWTDPQNPREEYRSSSNPNSTGTLKDLASQVTTNVVLQHKGAKFLKADPYPGCPGEAGLQTFSVPAPGGEDVLRVAFTQWNGAALTASYLRPRSEADNQQALDAMTRTVCTAPVGVQKLPAAPTVRPNPHSTVVPRAKGATIFMGRPPTPRASP
jgi:hypothetical protein